MTSPTPVISQRVPSLELHNVPMHRTLVLSDNGSPTSPVVAASIYPLSHAVQWWRDQPHTLVQASVVSITRDSANHPQLAFGQTLLLLTETEVDAVKAWLAKVYA